MLCAQIALIEHDRLLLVRSGPMKGWELPGGVVAPPELPEVAAMRALDEKTGYALLDAPDLFGVFPDPQRLAPRLYFTVFVSRNFMAPAAPKASSHGEFRWFPHDALPQDVSPVCSKIAGTLID